MKYIQANWPAVSKIKAYTTLRESWKDKKELRTLFNLPSDPIWLRQTHGIRVIRADSENNGQEGDASFTDQNKHVCAIMTADCLPLLICNKQGTLVAAAHAGWRGLANGIIEATLAQLAAPSEDLMVWLGPAIGPQKFEVGQDVYDTFVSQHAASQAAFIPHGNHQWLANLYELARIRLKMKGVSAIYGGNFCTYTQEDLFYSYRRDKGITGRMASLIWIDG